MKALSLRQPWADLVLCHGKRVENRCWNTKFRGEFLIDAAKGMTRLEYEEACAFANDVLFPESSPRDIRGAIDFANVKRGGIVGIARLVGVVEPTGLADVDVPGWHMGDQFGFVLEDVKPLPFVPCAGSLGFFRVPVEVTERLRAVARGIL